MTRPESRGPVKGAAILCIFAGLFAAAASAAWWGGNGPPAVSAAPRAHPVAEKSGRGGIRRSGLPLPRFASLRASVVNLRAGPGVRYPVEWVYHRQGLPVMIVAEFDAWRKVRDWRGTAGWIHRSMLTGRRTVVAVGREVVLRRKPARDAPAVARIEAGVVARVLACEETWCRIETGGVRGWGQRRALWGTLPGEKIK